MTQPFYFPDGRLANNANDLLELCKQYPDDATNFLVREDLEKWLAYIGSHDVAACAANARQTDLGDRQKLEEFLTRCHALNVEKPVTTPETPKEEPKKEVTKTQKELQEDLKKAFKIVIAPRMTNLLIISLVIISSKPMHF